MFGKPQLVIRCHFTKKGTLFQVNFGRHCIHSECSLNKFVVSRPAFRGDMKRLTTTLKMIASCVYVCFVLNGFIYEKLSIPANYVGHLTANKRIAYYFVCYMIRVMKFALLTCQARSKFWRQNCNTKIVYFNILNFLCESIENTHNLKFVYSWKKEDLIYKKMSFWEDSWCTKSPKLLPNFGFARTGRSHRCPVDTNKKILCCVCCFYTYRINEKNEAISIDLKSLHSTIPQTH